MPPGSGAFADVREIAGAQVRAWQLARFGQTYLLGGQQASFLELVTRIGALLGRRTPARVTPAFVLKAVAQLSHALSLISRKPPDTTPEAAAFTCHHLLVDSGKAIAALDYRETPLEPLLADTIAWMRGEGLLR